MADDLLSRDVAFSLLSNRRRRHLLCVLVQSEGRRSLQETAREIVGRLEASDSAKITAEAYRSVYVSLYQTHAPRLAAEGIVDYDETERTVRLAHNRRTRMLLRIVGIESNDSDTVDRRTGRVLTGVVVGTALCGLLGLVDPVWTVPWAVLVVGFLAFRVRQYAGTNRLAPVGDCGDLSMADRSPADVVDDNPHPDH